MKNKKWKLINEKWITKNEKENLKEWETKNEKRKIKSEKEQNWKQINTWLVKFKWIKKVIWGLNICPTKQSVRTLPHTTVSCLFFFIVLPSNIYLTLLEATVTVVVLVIDVDVVVVFVKPLSKQQQEHQEPHQNQTEGNLLQDWNLSNRIHSQT